MNVYQVKNVISKTNCADYIFSGLYCSEPIMSKDTHGNLIDNYAIYSRSDEGLLIGAPICIFGIYSEKEKTAYINDKISERFQKHLYPEKFENEELIRKARILYMDLFPEVRDMYQLEKNVDAQVVQNYLETLRVISGNMLFNFYKQLFPSFFEWAKTL